MKIYKLLKYLLQNLYKIPTFYVSLLSVIFTVIGGTLIPLYFKEILNVIVTNGSVTEIYKYFYYFVITTFIGFISWRISDYSFLKTSAILDFKLSQTILQQILSKNYDFFLNNFGGSITKKYFRFVNALKGIYEDFAFSFFRTFIGVIGMTIVLGFQNIILAFCFFIWTVLFIGLVIFLQKYRIKSITAVNEIDSKIGGYYSDIVSNSISVKIFGAEEKELKESISLLEQWKVLEFKSMWSHIKVYSGLSFLSMLGEIGLVALVLYFWKTGVVDASTLILVLTYQIMIVSQLFSLSFIIGNLSSKFSGTFEMFDILEQNNYEEIRDKKLNIYQGGICFQNLSFTYPEKEEKLFDNFNLEIKPYEKVALIGTSGSGKSSIIKLLFAFNKVDSGKILIDGQDINEINTQSLRKNIAYIPQDPILFHRSVLDNLVYGMEVLDMNKVIEITKATHCYDFIMKLEKGFDTLVGERGVKLSGGERQRVAIARALLTDKQILVFDEATSALDIESEKFIQNNLDSLFKGRTVLIVAHRLSTIKQVDRIIVLNKGKIVEQGSPKELKHKNGYYQKMLELDE